VGLRLYELKMLFRCRWGRQASSINMEGDPLRRRLKMIRRASRQFGIGFSALTGAGTGTTQAFSEAATELRGPPCSDSHQVAMLPPVHSRSAIRDVVEKISFFHPAKVSWLGHRLGEGPHDTQNWNLYFVDDLNQNNF